METSDPETSDVISLGDDDLRNVVEGDGLVLVEFHTEWCGTCQRMRPILERIAADVDATICTVDIEDHLTSAISFGGQRVPTFILFVDGKPVKQLRGPQEEQALRALIAEYSEEHATESP